ncbi:GGDEF domain [Vibrio variabilis]|uniref:diguanylate cyclase n=1 Tax=Vibrio variabilis TaxID=990271 RepID=A0ABQ0JGY4_9VIBR|nr:GGDEF domain [Vibrio variabilis]
MDTFAAFSLDMRTLNFVMILFSIIYCIGLLLFSQTQKSIKGLRVFALSLLVMGSGPLLISMRGVLPDWGSIVLANSLIAVSFQMIFHSMCRFRGVDTKYAHYFSWVIPVVVGLNLYYTYEFNSINSRVLVSAFSIGIVSLGAAVVVLNGKNKDYPVAVWMMTATLTCYGIFMLFRGVHTLNGPEIVSFMEADIVQKLAFLSSIFLIVSLSFSMLWMINARQVEAIYALSYFDPLTNLRNRRALDRHTDSLEGTSEKLTKKQCVIMLDIDRFKQINDRFGHVSGDQVIRSVAQQIKRTSGASKSIYRYGGDEFIVVLENQNLDRALSVAESMRQRVLRYAGIDGIERDISCSFGVAESQADESWDELVARADEALYLAKQKGRNCVQSASLESQWSTAV